MFTLTIETDNDAFRPTAHREIARLLRAAAKRIEAGDDSFKVMDGNGNSVGRAEFN